MGWDGMEQALLVGAGALSQGRGLSTGRAAEPHRTRECCRAEHQEGAPGSILLCTHSRASPAPVQLWEPPGGAQSPRACCWLLCLGAELQAKLQLHSNPFWVGIASPGPLNAHTGSIRVQTHSQLHKPDF